MSESHDNAESSTSAERKRNEYAGVGIVFALVGVALVLTLDTWAVGTPMIVLGIVFFAMGLKTKQAPKESGDAAQS